jgi:glycosyltransferase involved in cell wall biosynthesis
MTRGPLIACLMPCYNRMPKFHYLLAEAVESFLRQSYENKELVILNDTPGQTLCFDHPQVRVINASTRFAFVSDKIDYMINATRADVLCRWDDDDISLPHRLSYSLAKLGGQLQWRAGNYWYSPDGTLSDAHHPANTCIQAIFRREAITRIGGYPKGVSQGEDQTFDDKLAQAGICTEEGEIIPRAEIYYIYRWQTGSAHLSSKSGGANTNAHYEEIGRRPILPGNFVIAPGWRRDYVADADAASQK